MPKEYFFLYLIYGSAFILMGITALQKKEVEISNFPLVQSIKYLGWFGIIHGISEWVTMVVIADLYPDLYVLLFILKQFLKAVSFAFLMYFGVSLLPQNKKTIRYLKILPMSLFTVWLFGFTYLMVRYGQDYHILHAEFNTTLLRYIMGLTGSISSVVALLMNAKLMDKRKLKEIAVKYRGLAFILLAYGILDGVFVRPGDFFPASVINNSLFIEVIGLPIQMLKALVGIGITFLLIGVLKTFSWEQKEKLDQLQKNKVISNERRKLGLELHDSILQGLYAAGLKIEYLQKNIAKELNDIGITTTTTAAPATDKLLSEIKKDLNNVVKKTRDFLTSISLKCIELEELKENLQHLIDKFNKEQEIFIEFQYKIPSLTLGHLASEKCTQLYYLVQEAIINVVKHSKATKAHVILDANYYYLQVKVIDNGIGISWDKLELQQDKQFGIASMRERAANVGGLFNVSSSKGETKVELQVPWEDNHETNN